MGSATVLTNDTQVLKAVKKKIIKLFYLFRALIITMNDCILMALIMMILLHVIKPGILLPTVEWIQLSLSAVCLSSVNFLLLYSETLTCCQV
ncbi:UNVERIFIED_CONTAM: hypothetical protein K2H54_043056 [Gekko kuhli]